MTLVVHNHITEDHIAAAIGAHQISLTLILHAVCNDEDVLNHVQDQICALATRDPGAARRLARLLYLLADTARDGADVGAQAQREAMADPFRSGALATFRRA